MSQYAIDFNGTTTSINCGSDASLDDLHDGAMTVEAWVKADGWGGGGYGRIVDKKAGSLGWLFFSNSGSGLNATIYCATTNGASKTTPTYFSDDGLWHHVAFTWDDSSYTVPRLWVDGVERTTSITSRSGTVNDESAVDLVVGNNTDYDRGWDGEIAWVRISDTVRWTTTFTPDAKDAPPTSDANVIEQWSMNTGSGTTAVAEESSPTNDGTIANGSWVHYGALQIITKGIGTPSTIKGFLTRGLAVTVSKTGAVSQTLGDLTSIATGDLDIAGTVTRTLAALTLESVTTLDIEGTSSSALEALVSTSTGELDIVGQTTSTLAALTLVSTGVSVVSTTGSADVTLAVLTSIATGELDIAGQTTSTLEYLGLGAQGELDISAQAIIVLEDISVLSASALDISGALTQTLDNVTLVSTAVEVVIEYILSLSTEIRSLATAEAEVRETASASANIRETASASVEAL